MMKSDVNTSKCPSLEPIWTDYYNLTSMPKTVLRAARSPLLAPSPISPESLPSPMYPASYNNSMRRQDRALVDSLDQRSRHRGLTSPTFSLSSEERSPLVLKLEQISLLPSVDFEMRDGLPTYPPSEAPPSATESKPITIRGPLEVRTHTPGFTLDALSSHRRRRDSAVYFSPYHELRSIGHIHFDNARTADAFIIPRSLRRESNPFTETSHPSSLQGGDELLKLKMPHQLTVRVVIRPRAHERKLFRFQHTFDMDELRATIPDPPPPSDDISDGGQVPASSPAGAAHLPVPKRRPSTRKRSSSSASSTSPRDARPGQATDYASLLTDPKTMPIHLRYARVFLPVLAGLLQLADVRPGDVVYLPVPRAGAWPQTLRYAYTGRAELLTPAVRANIVYLAGKV